MREIKALQQPDAPPAAEPASQFQRRRCSAECHMDMPSPLQDVNRTTPACWPRQRAACPLQAWFAARQIEAQFDYAQVDTSGFL